MEWTGGRQVSWPGAGQEAAVVIQVGNDEWRVCMGINSKQMGVTGRNMREVE